MTTQLVLDALEQAIWTRQRDGAVGDGSLDPSSHTATGGLSTRRSKYSERLAEAGIAASVGSVGDSFDNALAETINGLYKTELIKPRGPWRTVDDVEIATAEWVDWFNHRRLYEYCGDVPPADLEAAYYAQHQPQPSAEVTQQRVSGHAGAVHTGLASPGAAGRRPHRALQAPSWHLHTRPEIGIVGPPHPDRRLAS